MVGSGSSKFKKNRPGPERGSVVSKNLKIMLDFFLVLFSISPGTLEVMVTSLRARGTASLRPPMP
jgi:hypothetical protein